jgi:phage FluMu protein Com
MTSKQFDEFWEMRCPKCKEIIDLEILVNQLKKKNLELTITKK